MKIERCYCWFLRLYCIASCSLLLLSITQGESERLIVSDGKAYYAWVRSLLLDGDLHFDNDYRLLYPPDRLPEEARQLTPKGNLVNKYPIGLALLEIPGFLVGHSLALILPSVAPDGVSTPYQIAVTFSLLCLYLWSFWLLFKAMLAFGCQKIWACVTGMMMLGGTNLIHYLAKEPAMAHAAGCAIFNIIVYAISRWSEHWDEIPLRSKFMLGGLVGLLFLLRNSNMFFFPAIFVFLFSKRLFTLKPLSPIILSMGMVISLQYLSAYFLWGKFQLMTYPNESFQSGLSGIINTLLSHRHGLFIYHPWYLLLIAANIAALVFHHNRVQRVISLAALVCFAILLAMNGTWWCWWFGTSFGNRAFIEALPLLSIGAGLFLSQRPLSTLKTVMIVIVCVGVCLANLYLWAGYLLQKYPHDGNHTITRAYFWMKPPQDTMANQ